MQKFISVLRFVGFVLVVPVQVQAAKQIGGRHLQSINVELIGVLVLIVILLGAIGMCCRIYFAIETPIDKTKEE